MRRRPLPPVGIVGMLFLAASVLADPPNVAPLKQRTVLTQLKTDTQRLVARIPPAQPGHEDVAAAQSALTSLKSITESLNVPLSQQSLQSLNDLDLALRRLSSQSEIKERELVQLRAVSDDLRIKNDDCLTMWSRGAGLKEVSVVVHTPDKDDPRQDVNGCQVAYVMACFYGEPDQAAHTHWFPGVSSPTRDLLTPGLYYWWTTLGSRTLMPAVRHEVLLTSLSQTEVTLSVPAPPSHLSTMPTQP